MPRYLALLPVLVCLADGLVTLLGQTTAYWVDPQAVRERAPHARVLLELHPLAFSSALVVYAGMIYTVVRRLPQGLALFATLAWFSGHVRGVLSWLPRLSAPFFEASREQHYLMALPLDLIAFAFMAGALLLWYRGTDDAHPYARWFTRTSVAVGLALATAVLIVPLVREATLVDAAGVGAADEAARLARKYPAQLAGGDERGRTPLHHAAANGHVETARVLLDVGAPVNALDNRGRTPLHEAVAGGSVPLVRLLLRHGARPDIPDRDDDTPRRMAQLIDLPELVALFAQQARADAATPSHRRR